jgi:hypothetical protein
MEYEAKNMVEIMEKLITDDDATTAWGMQSEFNRIWKEQKTDSPAYEAMAVVWKKAMLKWH